MDVQQRPAVSFLVLSPGSAVGVSATLLPVNFKHLCPHDFNAPGHDFARAGIV
eukprot:CAMPEP_0168358986 /NCGR_PEP_ID=MMETSP0228-20121227/1403_1 /TAXON_ID=133427 /ORGANISM="Protoceratium reticulatum, Strain CCCM 535 (=CCMP 1889)" /LENGTH=52 /DNA_ID=CAMNT_0008371589 /DNA_START=169 /DNA_END=323 /DNA_ORIENTATION=-